MERGLVFNIQRFSVHDGPGLRTTVFLKGCPARCPWCHNPESQAHAPELLTFPERCIDCGTCREVCPRGTDPTRCTACGACVEPCPADARQLAGREMSVRDVMDVVTRDRIFYEESGGGVTFSGGEPFAQPTFLGALLREAKAEGLSAAVDTCGFVSRDLLLQLAPLVDLFLYDVKVLDPERHLGLVGVPLAPILSNLDALAAADARIWLRVPVVPSLTDDEAGLEQIARLASSLRAVQRVSLLPYHRTGIGKLRRLHRNGLVTHAAGGAGRSAPPARRPGPRGVVPALESPSDQRMIEIAEIFRARGVDVRIGG